MTIHDCYGAPARWKGKLRRRVECAAGWSLIEVMIVCLIIGLLLTMALPQISAARVKVRRKQADGRLEVLSTAILRLAWDTGRWPNRALRAEPGTQEITDLSAAEAGLVDGDTTTYPGWQGPYLKEVGKDPWGQDYWFDPDYHLKGDWSKTYIVVGSYGPNGRGVNLYDDDDIVRVLGKVDASGKLIPGAWE